jgi:hypothetical protein
MMKFFLKLTLIMTNSSWRIFQKKCDFYYFILHHKWFSESPRSTKNLFFPALNYLSLSFRELEEKSENLVVKYSEGLSFHLPDELLRFWEIDRSNISEWNQNTAVRALKWNSLQKIIRHFCEHLYCPVSFWYPSGNSFYGRKSFQ